jgi:hypothetical protein
VHKNEGSFFLQHHYGKAILSYLWQWRQSTLSWRWWRTLLCFSGWRAVAPRLVRCPKLVSGGDKSSGSSFVTSIVTKDGENVMVMAH